MNDIVIRATIRADRAKVFALIKDSSTWPQWANFDSAELERPGTSEPYGVGAIRVLRTRVITVREEIVKLVPDLEVAYVMLSGLPLDNYRGEVLLWDAPGGGTGIRWSVSFVAQFAAFGWLWKAIVTRVIGSAAADLAKAAEAA